MGLQPRVMDSANLGAPLRCPAITAAVSLCRLTRRSNVRIPRVTSQRQTARVPHRRFSDVIQIWSISCFGPTTTPADASDAPRDTGRAVPDEVDAKLQRSQIHRGREGVVRHCQNSARSRNIRHRRVIRGYTAIVDPRSTVIASRPSSPCGPSDTSASTSAHSRRARVRHLRSPSATTSPATSTTCCGSKSRTSQPTSASRRWTRRAAQGR